MIQALAPINGVLLGSNIGYKYIYRGTSNEKHDLKPSAWRTNVVLDPLPNIQPYIKKENEYALKEYSVVYRFFMGLKNQGVAIPGYSLELETYLENGAFITGKSSIDYRYWPAPIIHQLLARAQHAGVPTRLLDWTGDSYVALYFSASGAYAAYQKNPQSGERLAIWALPLSPLINGTNNGRPDGIVVIKPHRHNNPNMLSQDGYLMYHPCKFTYTGALGGSEVLISPDNLDGNSYDDVLIKRASNFITDSEAKLIKFTLPVSLSGQLLKLLDLLGYNSSRIYPNDEGARRYAMEGGVLSKQYTEDELYGEGLEAGTNTIKLVERMYAEAAAQFCTQGIYGLKIDELLKRLGMAA